MPKKTEATKTVKVKRTSIGLEEVTRIDPAFDAAALSREPVDFDEEPTTRRHLRAVK